MPRTNTAPYKIIDSITTTGVSKAIPVTTSKDVTVAIVTSGTVNLQVQPLVGMKQSVNGTVDFSAAAGDGNLWSTASFSDVNDQSPVDGSTGLTITSAGVTLIEFNVDGVDFAGLKVSAYTSGTISAYLVAYSND